MQMLDIIHSYLSSSELFAKWHELLFSRAIKYSEILLQYISSKTIDKSNVSLLHKQMLLLFINKSATEQTVHSEMVQRVAFGESIKKFTVSFEIICSFICEEKCTRHTVNNWNGLNLTGRRGMGAFEPRA